MPGPRTGSSTPYSYILIRLLFRFVLKIFYGSIVVEGQANIPKTGRPCIVTSNHSNSLTDALVLVTAIPPVDRNMLRLTAKATQFGQRSFTSWLIEAAGTVPVKRRKDYADGITVDNTDVMEKLMEALELGDAVCLFPEGLSRYHPTIAPLKTGVARLISDVLTRNRNDPDFEISLLNCSITYMHRQHFRSDVLVSFHPPMTFSSKTHPELLAPIDYKHIRQVTAQMYEQISSGTIDAPSWDVVRLGKLAARIYAPLGTRMRLGDHVRVVRAFIEAFKAFEGHTDASDDDEKRPELPELRLDLSKYQDQLTHWGLTDERVRRPTISRPLIFARMVLRFVWAWCLFTLSLPGLVLWTPVFLTTFYAVHNFKKASLDSLLHGCLTDSDPSRLGKPIFDTWDEIAQYKLIYGLMSGLVVWLGLSLVTFPFSAITFMLVPALMWMALRWLEDAVSAFRAFTAHLRLLLVGKSTLRAMQVQRKELYPRIMDFAVNAIGLPDNPEVYFTRRGGKEKGRVQGGWEFGTRYFSIKRRRKRDWEETLLYDVASLDLLDYPNEE
ncbi:hypothetical protein FB45DRAFT_998368 [Roridomyces roridus]|uniref:Phospholipid/glycerol acyltransferase domain-containing protein n=1 Tax=Roridomyces roridus TaxID=1738132 RepID=A0AAD7FZ29_9AGAR|nr:hypothetical protein FB45DRAFT_998368 [Roridomyces roridus]